MGRMARIVVPGLPHHVTQMGNRRGDVFVDPEDRVHYLSLIKKYAPEYGVEVLGYCLMTSHVHFVPVPEHKNSLSRALRDAPTAYALRFNRQPRRNGPLWQGRFFSCPLDDEHLWAAVRYVERHPVRAGIVDQAEDYPWSSAAAHCGLRQDLLLSPRFPPAERPNQWNQWLCGEESAASDIIRRQTVASRCEPS